MFEENDSTIIFKSNDIKCFPSSELKQVDNWDKKMS